ncbi:MAG: nuclease-related domain-containing protein [Alphaproteobacteria bacterium]|nr:nuclease-related domain-containing protein [Alphaproteobacteria bacterium]
MEILIVLIAVVSFVIYKIWRHTVITKQNNEIIQSVTSLSKGTASERHLILTLLKSGIHPQAIFHDLYITKNDGKFSQIDLVVATRVGIIVFEVKDFSGWIYGKGNQTKWTQVLAYGNEKYRFYNPIMQNNTHIKQLRQKLKENVPFYSVIVFYGNSELQDISFIPRGTFVTKWYRVVDVVNTIVQENPLANYKDKHRVVEILKEAVVNGNKLETENQHIENIKDMLGTDRIFQ